MRNGSYGKRTVNPRQRYLCTPGNGEKPHAFTPPLPRDHVHVAQDQCAHCDELRGVHRGEAAVARRHSWSSRIVARGLEQLSRGASYAEVGRWALRVGGTPAGSSPSPVLDPLLDPEVEPLLEPASAQDPESGSGISGRSAAGAAVTAPATVEAALDPDAPPVRKRRRVSPSSKASHSAWHVAAGWTEAFAPVVYADVEQRLRHGAVTERARLHARLAAGRPLDRPQVLLRDDGITAAVEAHFDPTRTRFVPSLWHVGNAVRTGLADTSGAFVPVTGVGKQLRPELATHLKQLQRDGALGSATAWTTWWDELENLVGAIRHPRDKTRLRRRNDEAPMAEVLPYLLASPPFRCPPADWRSSSPSRPTVAGDAPLRVRQHRAHQQPVRPAREHEAFDDPSAVAALLRGDAGPHGGWTVPLRAVADPRPRGGRYSSLRDATLLASLATERGLA